MLQNDLLPLVLSIMMKFVMWSRFNPPYLFSITTTTALFLLLIMLYHGGYISNPIQFERNQAIPHLINPSDCFSSADLPRKFHGQSTECPECLNPLKVYMYDLPGKFNLDLLVRNNPGQKLQKKSLPKPNNSGLRRQHNVAYWMMASLMEPSKAQEGRTAIRVTDPNMADIFFVPFFASLSLEVHSGQSMRDPENEKDNNLQIELLKILGESKWWKRSGGRDHIFVIHHPNAFRFWREMLNSSVLVVADLSRYPKDVASLAKDIIAPYNHMVPTFENDDTDDPFRSRTTLLFFQGRIKRKDEGVVRSKLADVLKAKPGVHYEEGTFTSETAKQATVGMRNSKFCLSPAGDTASSCRLFDAIVSHCVPIIVSDKIELPFEDDLDYRKFSLFFSKDDAVRPGFLLHHLENFPKEEWLKMWKKLKEVTHHFEYQHPSQINDATNMIWKQAYRKVPVIKRAIHRLQRLKIPDWS